MYKWIIIFFVFIFVNASSLTVEEFEKLKNSSKYLLINVDADIPIPTAGINDACAMLIIICVVANSIVPIIPIIL